MMSMGSITSLWTSILSGNYYLRLPCKSNNDDDYHHCNFEEQFFPIFHFEQEIKRALSTMTIGMKKND